MRADGRVQKWEVGKNYQKEIKPKKYAKHELINPPTFRESLQFTLQGKIGISSCVRLQGGLISPQIHIN